MRKILLILTCILSLMIIPISAQDEATEEPEATDYDCTTIGINRQVDTWYNTYVADRGEFETEQALEAAQELADNLADISAVCALSVAESGTEEVFEQTGIGTIDAPFIIQAPGIVGDVTIDITQSILPADDVLAETGIPAVEMIPEGQEYFLVRLTISCRAGSTRGCRVNQDAFRVIGDLGVLYMPTLSEYDEYLPTSNALLGGTERSGAIPFLVDQDDTSLRLVYYPNGDALESNALAYYFDAQGSANAFEVSATTSELIIRGAPSRSGAPVGVLRSSQVAEATGRNADGTWIYVIAPEGEGWVSAEFVESDSPLDSLSVLEE